MRIALVAVDHTIVLHGGSEVVTRDTVRCPGCAHCGLIVNEDSGAYRSYRMSGEVKRASMDTRVR